MIQPTIGRVVWFHPAKEADEPFKEQPFAALIAHVLSDRLINVGYFDQNGNAYAAQNVTLLQEDDDVASDTGHFAMWMPFQISQAKKAEAEQPVSEQVVEAPEAAVVASVAEPEIVPATIDVAEPETPVVEPVENATEASVDPVAELPASRE